MRSGLALRPTRSSLMGFVAGSSMAAATSACLVVERVSLGDGRVALLVNLALTCVALLTLHLIERWRLENAVVSQALGAAFGIALVHLALHLGWLTGAAWLVERPAQLVNDVVAVGATLVILRACARGMSVRALVGALVLVSLYRATGRLWHVDAPPFGFHLTVQQLVVAQLGALAVGLMAYDAVTRDAT